VSIVTALRAMGHGVDVLSPPGVDPFDAKASVPVDKAATRTKGWSSIFKWLSCHLPNWIFELAEIGYNLPAYVRVRRALRAKPYDLVFERYAFYLLAGAMAAHRERCQFLLEVNETSGIPGRARQQSFPRLCAWFERRLFRHCRLVHAVSSYLGQRVVGQGMDARRVVVVPNGFDGSRVARRNRDDMRRQLGFGGRLVIGFAGWFDHWDRLDFLVDVFAEVHRRHTNLCLCLVGHGPGVEQAEAKISELGLKPATVLTGAVPRHEVYDYLQTFDIGVLPHSNVFGSPIVMFEMMGLNIPLMMPRLPPIEDVHRHGHSALLFEPLNQEECVDRMTALVESAELRQSLAARASALLTQEHSWVKTAQRIIEAYFVAIGEAFPR
jgi:glycosyltransferase involved in cell wall biosynthesis